MVGWIILGMLAALLLVLLCLRVSVNLAFGEELRVTVQLGPKVIQIVPPPEKRAKAEKRSVKPSKTESKSQKKPVPVFRLTFDDMRGGLRALWQAVKGALRRAGKRIRIDPLNISIVLGDENPANTAEWYGWVNTAVWTVMPRLEEWVDMPDPRIHMEMDFSAAETTVSGTVGFRYRVADLLAIAFAAGGPVLRFGIPFLKRQRAMKKAAEKQAAQEAAKEKGNNAPKQAA